MENNEESNLKNWTDCDVKMMISLCGEIEPNFLKNATKQGKIFIHLKFVKKLKKLKKSDFGFGQFVFLKALAFAPGPPLTIRTCFEDIHHFMQFMLNIVNMDFVTRFK